MIVSLPEGGGSIFQYPLLDNIASIFPDDVLTDSLLIGCQHLLPSIEILLHYLFSKGLSKQNVALIGKCYSTSHATFERLKQYIYVHPSSIKFNSYLPYSEAFRSDVEDFVNYITKTYDLKIYKNIIVLDDGGILHLTIKEKLAHYHNIIGIEQTSRGSYLLSNTALNYTVVNVARSKAKLAYESSMVAEAVINGFETVLDTLSINLNHVLVVGNGSVGNALANLLGARYQVTAYDTHFHKSDLSVHELKLQAKSIDAVIGCTGQNILPFLKEIQLIRPGIVLASASSLDIELNSSTLRRETEVTYNCHENLFINGLYLLNCGFPINFCGSQFDTIPLQKLQFTLALLFAGTLQAVLFKSDKPGLVELDNTIQTLIIEDYLQRYSTKICKVKDLEIIV